MTLMDKKLNRHENTDILSFERRKIEQVAQLYFVKNVTYICKRIQHRLVEKVIKQWDGKSISKDQIQDQIYKYLKQLMGWIETGKCSVMELRQKNQETIRLKKKLMEQKMIQKQKDQKIERRNQRIKKLSKIIEQKESLKIEAKDIEEAKIIKQRQFYKELCGDLVNNLQLRNQEHSLLKKQLDEIKIKYRLAHSRLSKLMTQALRITELFQHQRAATRRQNNKLKSRLESVQQNCVLLEQQCIRKEQECQFLKDYWESFKPINKNVELELQTSKTTCVGDLMQKTKCISLSSNTFNYTYHLQKFSFQTQMIQEKTKQVLEEQNKQKSQSSQSQYIYECDFGIQCTPISTRSEFSQTEIYRTGQNEIRDNFYQPELSSLHQNVYEQIKKLENERNCLSSANKSLVEEKNYLCLQLEISRKTEQICQKQIQQLKIENEARKAQFSELKHQLIRQLQRDQKKQKHCDSNKLEEMEMTISLILKQNVELKKYNQQLMQTIQYANSLLSGNQNNHQNIESKHVGKNISRNDYGVLNGLSYNWTESTGSHFQELSQKSSESSLSKYEQKYTYQKEYGEQKQCQSQSESSKQQHARQFKKAKELSLQSQDQPQKSKQVQRYGMAVARLLSEFINSQNKQEIKMNAFRTLVQLIKPNAQLKEKFDKFIKIRKRISGIGTNREDKPMEDDDIKNKLFRFLTSN